MSGATFVRFYPSDWRSGCIGLTLEQEGFYIRLCAFIYDTDQRLPADNDSVAAKLLGLHTNAYRKVRDQLAALGKIVRRGAEWTVPRADRELAAATNSARGQNGSVDQNTGRQTSPDPLGDTTHNTPLDTTPDTRGVFSGNANDFNGLLKSQEPIAIRKEGNTTVRSEYDAEPDRTDGRTTAFGDLKRAFNGSTEAMLEFVERAMGGRCRQNAEQWLASTVSAHGAQNVAQAFAMIVEKQAAGEIIVRPLPHWSSLARSIRDKQPSRSQSNPPKRTLADALRDAKLREQGASA